MRLLVLLLLSSSFARGIPAYALTVTQDPDVPAAQANFGAAATQFNWAGYFPAGGYLAIWDCRRGRKDVRTVIAR